MQIFDIYRILKQFLFLVNFLFIIGSEWILFFIFMDYYVFIERLCKRLASINILYVKIFQSIALNNRLIDNDINNILLEYTNNAPWNFNDIDLYSIIEITDKYNLTIKSGYEVPLNAGMISLVFKAYKTTGEPVIIKMKRKNIENKLNDAIDNLLFLVEIMSNFSFIQKYQISDIVKKNIDIITLQTNFQLEVQNIITIRNNCKKLKYIKIPEVYKEITDEYPNCIVMEYINGVIIDKVKEEDYEPFAKQVLKFGFITTLIHGFAHGDLHAGNILFIKDNNDDKYKYKLGILDFGIMYEIPTSYKNKLFELTASMFELPSHVIADNLLNSGIIIQPVNILKKLPQSQYNEILKFSSDIIQETIHTSKKANQFQMYKFLSEFKKYLCKNEIIDLGLRPSDEFVKIQLVLAMAHGVTLLLCKDDYIKLADKVIHELFHLDTFE